MAIEIKVPNLPESVADATIAIWHKKTGDSVAQDENLVDIETDKVVLEVRAPAAGKLEKILEDTGATVTAEQVIGLITAGKAADNSPPPQQNNKNTTATATASDAAAETPAMGPAARKLLDQHQLSAEVIQGSGKAGRILKEDVIKHIESKSQPTETKPATTAAGNTAAETVADSTSDAVDATDLRMEKRVPMTRLRARIAERLLDAQANAAILTTFNEVNMQPVMTLRNNYKDAFEKAHGVKLGFMSFFIKAAVEALKRFPEINASIDGHDIVYHNYYDIGVAVSSPRGLVVPIIRNAENLGMAAIEAKIVDYGQKAKNGNLTIEDMTGGTFTISNGGIFGSLLSTPILNPPQSGILGMHRIQDKPVAENGQVVIRPMMYLALSYDHRIVDGREAVQFLVTVRDLLEDPARMLLEL